MLYCPVDDHLLTELPQQRHLRTDYSNPEAIDRILNAAHHHHSVQFHLSRLQRSTELTSTLIKDYIRQFNFHALQDSRREGTSVLQSALQLFVSQDDRNPILCYLLGFEIITMLFEMSWQQHERLYYLQHNQEYFFHHYIKPIQMAHRLNDKIIPRDADIFFAKRSYFIQRPLLRPQQLKAIAIATFPAETILQLGFEVMRHPRSFIFEASAIFDEPEMTLNRY
jgi:hypothetical protein